MRRIKAVSPVIATLLLILIAVAAGVIVYGYVVGFIGTSTKNTTVQQSVMSVDVASASSTTNKVTAYVRNSGSTATTPSAFYISGTKLTINIPITYQITTGTTWPATTITLAFASSTTVTVTLSATAAVGNTLTIGALGGSVAIAGGSTSGTLTVGPGISLTSAYVTTASASVTPTTAQQTTDGALAATANDSIILCPNTAQQFNLTGVTLTAGTVYTVSIIATDGSQFQFNVKAR